MSEEEKAYNELEENYEKIVEMLSNGNFLQLNGKAINLAELNEYINAQQKEIERLNNIINKAIEYIEKNSYTTLEKIDDINYFIVRLDKCKDLLDILKGSDKE